MIVTCPACSARYKIKESRIQGRGAKITCPRCGHRFVVYRDTAAPSSGAPSIPDDVDSYDFRTLGITWKVRKGIGVTYNFHDLATLKAFIQDGQVDRWDKISYDQRNWKAIDSIDDLRAYFHDIWQKARRGEISVSAAVDDELGEDEEDEADAPTTIVGHGSTLASEIRRAVSESATPAPVPSRSSEAVLVDEATQTSAAPTDSEMADTVPVAVPDTEPAPLAEPEEPPSGGSTTASSEDASPAAAAPAPASPAAKASPKGQDQDAGAPWMVAGGALLLVLGLVAAWAMGLFGGTEPSPAPSSSSPAHPQVEPAPRPTKPPATPTPVKPTPTPDAQQATPEAPKPAREAPKPASAAPKPAPEAPKPASAAPKPAPATPKPASEAPKPAPEAPKPAPEAPKPAPEAPKPAPEAPKPAPEAPKPAPASPAPEPGTP